MLEAIKLIKSVSGRLRLMHVVDEFVMDGLSQPGMHYQRLIESLVAAGRAVLEQAQSVVHQQRAATAAATRRTASGSLVSTAMTYACSSASKG